MNPWICPDCGEPVDIEYEDNGSVTEYEFGARCYKCKKSIGDIVYKTDDAEPWNCPKCGEECDSLYRGSFSDDELVYTAYGRCPECGTEVEVDFEYLETRAG